MKYLFARNITRKFNFLYQQFSFTILVNRKFLVNLQSSYFQFLIPNLVILFFSCTTVFAQEVIKIPDDGWRLWCDTSAQWQNDKLYLPDEFELKDLLANPPSGGWDVLNDNSGIPVKLPSTIEEHYWGKFGYKPYTDGEYWFGREDNQVKNGNYLGVSWWWTNIDIPKSFESKKVILFIRGARLRAEVYLNQKLVGYNIINEVSFKCDLTEAINPGKKNLLAIRITNPGGRLDWADTQLLKWGEYSFQKSHGFGGLDRGIKITAHNPIYFDDLYVLNNQTVNRISVISKIQNSTAEDFKCKLQIEVIDPAKSNQVVATTEKELFVKAKEQEVISTDIVYDKAELWSDKNPKLYKLKTKIVTDKKEGEVEEINFGFRWFEADGIGTNAMLRLNKNRIRLYSAISWGFWGYNGLWPTPELAEKEVKAAKELGMNCIQFHRNVGKAEVLDAQDRLGLLRYMEPGGGQSALGEKYSMYAKSPTEKIDDSGKNGDSNSFAEKYMEEKIVRMIQDHRNHPSLILYCVQNEINPDLKNPRIFHLIKRMHQEDPSRIVILKSGIPPNNQVWMKPYDDRVYYDSGNGFSGWWDQHTVGGPGVWRDDMYKNPEDFTHRSTNQKEIVTWGEMLGCAVPDNHPILIEQIKNHGSSYDLEDHEVVLEAYEKFIDKWNFRSAFKTTENLFKDIGNKSYDFWGRVVESARLSDENDFLVMSGWESTAIENHSGLVDNLRNFKGDPNLIKSRLALAKPTIKFRSLVIPIGGKAVFDIYWMNELNHPLGTRLHFFMTDPSGKREDLKKYEVLNFIKDQFVYKIAVGEETPVLNQVGKYKFVLERGADTSMRAEEEILVVDPTGEGKLPNSVAVISDDEKFIQAVGSLPGVLAEKYNPQKKYEAAIITTRLKYGWRSEVDSTTEIQNTDDDVLFHTESWGYWENLEYVFSDLPKGKAKVTLRFAEVTLNKPKARIFDVAINGDTVLKNFDIFSESGGRNIAIDKIFTIDVPDGVIKITVPKLTTNYGKFSALKIEAGEAVIAINCGGKPYKDKNGLIWKKYEAKLNLDEKILEKVKEGMSLLVLPEGEDASLAYGRKLGDAGAFNFIGHVGETRAPWMGSWYFVRSHPVYSGLPVNCAMGSYYQVPVDGADGILLDGENVEVFAGYGRDHDRNIGAASFSSKLGKGKILFHTIPGIISGMKGTPEGIHPVMLKRLMMNSLRYLSEK
ncbi:MAG: malectin domain-containing carbohydrate-binding protein [Ignavibacteriales bacterium]|nr:malectin domain-containing carbohydrate-binding protein [Ignavibacteriales bacterium]